MRDASVAKLIDERRRVARRLSSFRPANWQPAGPTDIGGRCTSLVCHPGDPDRLWIGAAGGGVWSSRDAGRTWAPAWRARAPLEIGALAIDPSNPRVLYSGTGEANGSADSYAGDGLYRTKNGGVSWQPFALSEKTRLPRRIGAIAVDPFDPAHILVGGLGYGRVSTDRDIGGLYATKNGGRTWQRATFVSANNYWCHAIVFDPQHRGVVFATVTGPGTRSGIYRSKNGGASWTQLRRGLPPTERIGRTSIALAPSDPRIVWALCADMASEDADRVLGVFRSTDGGTSWRNVAGTHFRLEGQMSYGNAIAVHPLDPDHVICGGVDLHVTKDAGATWRTATRWDATRGTARYAHADHHALVFAPSLPDRVHSANDGGLDLSPDGGKTWTNRSNGLEVTMFYDVDVAATDERRYGGGAQDNGTLVTSTGKIDDFTELLGGDGGWMVFDPQDAGHVYASFQLGGMYRFRGGSARDVSPPFRPDESRGIWMVYITFDPRDSETVYTGNQRVYRTTNDGVSWKALTPVLDGSPISAIEVAPADPNCIYVGTENGGFFRSLDRGATWSANLADSALPGVMITRIETHPQDAALVFVTVGNSGNSHVFRSRDAGSIWHDIDGGRLPDAPHQALLIRPDAPSQLWVCTDAGVFVTQNGGRTWRNATGNLPPTMVVDLVYHERSKTLVAATYGRSIWKLALGR
ncbi:MAG TPA: hypothetical protein VFZ65_14520 [Planctomycetota bacterium]|nr:hypothetical protein [Planctomycetota bacterium]